MRELRMHRDLTKPYGHNEHNCNTCWTLYRIEQLEIAVVEMAQSQRQFMAETIAQAAKISRGVDLLVAERDVLRSALGLTAKGQGE
jgi:hypothetical protein